MIHKFTECLNDTFDWLILADPQSLQTFKEKNNLGDDLLKDFTQNDSGDRVVAEGAMIPLTHIENTPYTIYFNLNGEDLELQKPNNDLQFHQKGYLLEVTSNFISLFTVPYLWNYDPEHVIHATHRPQVTLENGWYEVSVLGGQTQQLHDDGNLYDEPTLEFVLTKVAQAPKFSADIHFAYRINESLRDNTIIGLEHIINNPKFHSADYVARAKELLPQKIKDWTQKNQETALKIDNLIRQQGWYDFQVYHYDGANLTIGGDIDLTYHHSIEIRFEEVFFVSGFFGTWCSNTDEMVFEMANGEKLKELNIKYEIEQYNHLFIFTTEDYKNDVIIAAHNVSYEINPKKFLRK